MIPVVVPFYKNDKDFAKCEEAIKEQDTQCFIVKIDDSETGNGFTATVNKGLKSNLDREFIVILNQDCFLKHNAISEMLKTMRSNPKAACCGITQLSYDGSFVTHGGTKQAYPSGVHITGPANTYLPEDKKMGWVNGACVMFRTEALIEVGLLDPTMKMVYSESDWCYRARSFGWEVWLSGNAFGYHELSSSTTVNPELKKDFVAFTNKWILNELYKDLALEVF